VCKKTGALFTRRRCPFSVTDHVDDNSLNDVVVSGSDCVTRAVAFFAVVLFDFYSDVPA
jgi:hypothetical protein